jgi:hypothetical protein
MTPDASPAERYIERRTVSRKTPGDGKLEITKAAAAGLEALGHEFGVVVGERAGDAHVGTMPCTCRGDDSPHVHYFIESDLFRTLTVGATVDLVADDARKRLLVLDA